MLKKSLPILVGAAVVLGCVGLGANAAYGTGNHGGGHTPVTICHNGHTITVDDSAMKAHLKHGDNLGACKDWPTTPSTPVTEPPEPPATTSPVPDVIEPHIQDYINCKGAAFVLDNTSSTVDVTYDINGLIYVVPAGKAIHTDAEGTIIQPNSDYEGYTIKAGDNTWHFESAGNCPSTPTTPPVTPEPTPTDTPTLPPVSTPTPNPTGEPSEPTSPEPTLPGGEPSETPVPSTEPTPSQTPSDGSTPRTTPTSTNSATPSAHTKTDSGTTPTTRHTEDTARTLAYTGISAVGPAIAAAVLLILGGIALLIARKRKGK